MSTLSIIKNIFLLIFILLPVLTQMYFCLIISTMVFFMDYIGYKILAIRRTNLDRMKALQIDKKEIKFYQEIAPTMQEGIKKKIAHRLFDDQRRYELISKWVSLNHEQYNILDIGCAEGILVSKLCYLSEVFVVGLDISGNLVRQGIKNARSIKPSNIDFVVGDAENLPFKQNSFDTIICSEVIEHVPQPNILLIEANRVLSNNGFMILTAPNATTVPMTFNPFIWLEYILGIRFPRLLSKRHFVMLAYWAGESSVILHRDFTFKELSCLVIQSKLKCIKMKSFGFLPTMLLARLLKISYPKFVCIENTLENIPILRHMGNNVIIYLKK